MRHAIIVRTKKETRRPDGRYIRFDDNAGVLLNNKVCGIFTRLTSSCIQLTQINPSLSLQRELMGTRVNGVVASELRQKGWSRICSLAPKVA